MTSQNGNMDIDMFLMRLNYNIPDIAGKWTAFVLPTLSVISLVFTIVVIILFRRQKDYTGAQKLVAAIMVMTTLSLLVRVPLSIKFFGDYDTFSDYMEYKWCEVFVRVNVDTPAAMNIAINLMKAGLAIQGLIMTFAPKKVKVWMTTKKTVAFCFLACALGACTYIPAMYLTTFLSVPWVSKHDPTEERECCVPYPGDNVLNIEFYQRDVYLGILSVAHAFPIAFMVVIGIILSVRLYTLKRISQADDVVENYQQKEVIRAISVCMFTYAGLELVTATHTLLVMLTYGKVDLGMDISGLQLLLAYFSCAENVCSGFVSVVTLLIFCCCDTRFRSTFMQLINRRND